MNQATNLSLSRNSVSQSTNRGWEETVVLKNGMSSEGP